MKRIIAFILMVCSSSVIFIGYASVTGELGIIGSASSAPLPKGVFIVNMEVVGSQGASDAGSEYFFPANVSSKVSVSRTGSITYIRSQKRNRLSPNRRKNRLSRNKK